MLASLNLALLWWNISLIGLFVTSWAVALPFVVRFDGWWRGGGDLGPVEGGRVSAMRIRLFNYEVKLNRLMLCWVMVDGIFIFQRNHGLGASVQLKMILNRVFEGWAIMSLLFFASLPMLIIRSLDKPPVDGGV
jgi:hypothetical protein